MTARTLELAPPSAANALAMARARVHYPSMNRDVIVIGASAGGVKVLLDLVAALPADLPATIFVVVHTAAGFASPLPDLLNARGPLPASHPLHEQKIVPGQIYIAPPDNHLLLRNGSMAVVRGPKENGHRPAADALFRSASAAYGPRVIGVVLSGYQDCGTAGMMSIKARGGVSVVQAPETAVADEMPRNVLKKVKVDHVVTPLELADLLVRLSRSSAGPQTEPSSEIHQLEGDLPGEPAGLVCPICTGVLSEAQAGDYHHFRCHVGHTFSLENLVREQGDEMERALWAAVRAMEESATLSLRLTRLEQGELRSRFAEKAQTMQEQADLIRRILLHSASFSAEDASQV
jgi:two-component system chemotaxis response regulator CheB